MGNLVIVHTILSFIFLNIVTVDWTFLKKEVARNGWDLEKCTPVHPIEIWVYFIPIVNVVFTYIILVTNGELATTVKEDESTTVSAYIWKFGFHYNELN